jgi:hypothetical protein
MVKFYSCCDNSFDTRGFPWAQEILRGVVRGEPCPECKSGTGVPFGEVEVLLRRDKGSRWPDVLGCGSWPLFILSGRVLRDWESAGIRDLPASPVRIAEPRPKGLRTVPPPDYFWLDGERMSGAELDFEASGFVGVYFCPHCGTRLDDIRATHRRRRSGIWPMAFVRGTWNGSHVLTTNLSPAYFFCTDLILELARKNRHTNFCFVPAEVAASSLEPLKYLPR